MASNGTDDYVNDMVAPKVIESLPIDFTKPVDYEQLKGRNALVTGGASGMGEAFVKMLAQAGANVIIADLNDKLGEQLEKDLVDAGQSAKFVKVDATSWASQIAMLKAAFAHLSRPELDIVLISAGVADAPPEVKPRDISTLDAESTRTPPHRAVDSGMLGTYYTTTLALEYGMGLDKVDLTQPASKSIVVLGSIAGFSAIRGNYDYSMSKFGIRGFFHSMWPKALELGVRMNELTPYFIDTPMIRSYVTELKRRGHKLGKIEDTAEAIARFATDTSIVGRAVCVSNEGLTDMRDDIREGYGSKMMGALHQKGAFSAW